MRVEMHVTQTDEFRGLVMVAKNIRIVRLSLKYFTLTGRVSAGAPHSEDKAIDTYSTPRHPSRLFRSLLASIRALHVFVDQHTSSLHCLSRTF